MANNPDNDFLDQILGIQTFAGGDPNLAGTSSSPPMLLQLNSGEFSGHLAGVYHQQSFPLGLSLEQSRGGFFSPGDAINGVKQFSNDLMHPRPNASKNVYHGQPVHNHVPVGSHQPTARPRVRARRGQATDPHSIAERLRRERIAERIRALQELVPSVNKTDRAAMLDEIVDYVKFLRLQVKVLSMSRLGGAGAVAPLVTDMSISSLEEDSGEGQRNSPAWERWSNDGTERQVAKMMEENVGVAMQFLQSKQLCIMPVSLASAIYHTQPSDASSGSGITKPELNPSS